LSNIAFEDQSIDMVIEPKLFPDTASPSAIVLQTAKHISLL